jgi:hypothetical protein
MLHCMCKPWLISVLLFIAASCCGPGTQTGGQVEYQERSYGQSVGGPFRLENLNRVLMGKPACTGTIDLTSRELHLTANEPHHWEFPVKRARIGHSSDLWRLRGNKIGYLNLFLIRRDASGKAVRIVRKQLGENGEMYPDHPDILKLARPGDLILGMWGF